ncbi:MAG: hypothetical protein QOI53_2782 [Verrucomicrobiota bacterium]|jgi:hypothetical protein|nr:hypothetical protein [Verrucomicrobiota bacterium]
MAELPDFRRRVFVVMPFGKKEVPKKPLTDLPPDSEAKAETLKVDFDAVYQKLLKPALEAAELQPFRADDEVAAGDPVFGSFWRLGSWGS